MLWGSQVLNGTAVLQPSSMLLAFGQLVVAAVGGAHECVAGVLSFSRYNGLLAAESCCGVVDPIVSDFNCKIRRGRLS
ncbi:hypothetical protein U1Q18_043883 [Sarracenia purpurea var. burkii]